MTGVNDPTTCPHEVTYLDGKLCLQCMTEMPPRTLEISVHEEIESLPDGLV
jgi:hypothetical protein